MSEIHCPFCGSATKSRTNDSRPSYKHFGTCTIKRRRECHTCGNRFRTYEIPEVIFEGRIKPKTPIDDLVEMLKALPGPMKGKTIDQFVEFMGFGGSHE